jgi:hypothetical protein
MDNLKRELNLEKWEKAWDNEDFDRFISFIRDEQHQAKHN